MSYLNRSKFNYEVPVFNPVVTSLGNDIVRDESGRLFQQSKRVTIDLRDNKLDLSIADFSIDSLILSGHINDLQPVVLKYNNVDSFVDNVLKLQDYVQKTSSQDSKVA